MPIESSTTSAMPMAYAGSIAESKIVPERDVKEDNLNQDWLSVEKGIASKGAEKQVDPRKLAFTARNLRKLGNELPSKLESTKEQVEILKQKNPSTGYDTENLVSQTKGLLFIKNFDFLRRMDGGEASKMFQVESSSTEHGEIQHKLLIYPRDGMYGDRTYLKPLASFSFNSSTISELGIVTGGSVAKRVCQKYDKAFIQKEAMSGAYATQQSTAHAKITPKKSEKSPSETFDLVFSRLADAGVMAADPKKAQETNLNEFGNAIEALYDNPASDKMKVGEIVENCFIFASGAFLAAGMASILFMPIIGIAAAALSVICAGAAAGLHWINEHPIITVEESQEAIATFSEDKPMITTPMGVFKSGGTYG